MRNGLKIVGLMATIVITILCGVWYVQAHHPVELQPVISTVSNARMPQQTPALEGADEAPSVPSQPVAPEVTENMATAFTHATDYAEFTHKIRAQAESGNAEAQYYMEEALRYCQQNLANFFALGGKRRPRTLDEAQAYAVRTGFGKHPELVQQQITDAYSRCHVFLEDPAVRAEMTEWTAWLDKAANNGFPAAESAKALQLLNAYQMAQYSQDSKSHADSDTASRAHELVLNALQSGDPQVLFQAADWVGVDHPQQPLTDEAATAPLAWRLLACERGYDCSANAEWVRSACTMGPTCTPGETGQQFLEEQAVALGANWDDVKRLAGEIGATVDAKDEAKLPSYLWAKR